MPRCFLESVPEGSAKLEEPNTKKQKFEDVVRSAEQADVLVLVYGADWETFNREIREIRENETEMPCDGLVNRRLFQL